MSRWFAITIFVGAAQLFWVQPMLAKMLLPPLGGAPAVWNTCLVFFQAMLLAGYAYAHLSTRLLGLRRQAVLHGMLLLVAAGFLPLRIPDSWAQALTTDPNPAWRLLACLLAVAGLPFFAVSSTSPLLQSWFSTTGDKSADDPYFLYAGGNLGSLVALLGYPVLIEPHVRLGHQTEAWAAGFALLAALTAACAIPICRAGRSASATQRRASDADHAADSSPSWPRRGRWLLLSFVPSSLTLSTTQHLVTDVASIPLLWVIPLAVYLLTYVLAFAPRRRRVVTPTRVRWLAVAALAVTFSIIAHATQPAWLLLLIHLGFLFCAALACHTQLADDRPSPTWLTAFYFWVALGGVLGGAFNALLAPRVFRAIAEYPLGIVLAGLLLPKRAGHPTRSCWRDIVWPGLLAAVTAALAAFSAVLPLPSKLGRNGLVFGVPLVIAFLFVDRPLRFGLGLGALFLGGLFHADEHGRTLRAERSFFGVSRVTMDPGGTFRRLVHGNTWHGAQFIAPERRCEPLVYYHRTGPLGAIVRALQARQGLARVGVIGLGTGSMACYARPGEQWTFYEIDPAVIRLAQDTNYFSYLARCAQGAVRIVPGDARLRLREAGDGEYDLLVLDAFSSDAIPVHLLTREALALYQAKLAPGGVLACHVSNRYLDFERVLAPLARDASMIAVGWDDWNLSMSEIREGKAESHWIALARRAEDLGRLTHDTRWFLLEASSSKPWSDDFSNLWSIFRWE